MKNLAIERLRLKAVALSSGTASPLAGGGLADPLGSRYLQVPEGRQWLKRGATAPSWIQLLRTSYYFNIVDFGAVGDGVTDNRVAINAAVTAAQAAGGGVVYIPPGDYAVYRNGVNPSVLLSGAGDGNLLFLGSGRSSRIIMTGDAGGGADWFLFQIIDGCRHVAFQNLCLDGSAIFNIGIGQPHHGVRIGGAMATSAGDVWFIDCYWNQFDGDGISTVGVSGVGLAQVQNINVVRGVFTLNVGNIAGSRAGITIQRNVVDVLVSSSYFTGGSDQLIDAETSGFGETARLRISRCHFLSTAPSSTMFALSGAAGNDCHDVCVEDCVMVGGIVAFANTRHVIYKGSIALAIDHATMAGAIEADSVVDLTVAHCQLFRQDTTDSVGFIFGSDPAAITTPKGIQIIGVIGENASSPVGGQDGVLVESGSQILVYGCQLYVAQAVNNAGACARFRAIAFDSNEAVCQHSILIGTGARVAAGVVFAATGGSSFTNGNGYGNIGDNLLNGVLVSLSGAGVVENVMFSDNAMVVASQMVNAPAPAIPGVAIGSLNGTTAAALWEFIGTPETFVPSVIGACGSDRAGGAATTFYVKEADAGLATGWAPF